MHHIIDKTFSVYNLLLMGGVVYFPFENAVVHKVMSWWWFRLCYLALVCISVIVLKQNTTALLLSILFVFGASVSNNRFVSHMDLV